MEADSAGPGSTEGALPPGKQRLFFWIAGGFVLAAVIFVVLIVTPPSPPARGAVSTCRIAGQVPNYQGISLPEQLAPAFRSVTLRNQSGGIQVTWTFARALGFPPNVAEVQMYAVIYPPGATPTNRPSAEYNLGIVSIPSSGSSTHLWSAIVTGPEGQHPGTSLRVIGPRATAFYPNSSLVGVPSKFTWNAQQTQGYYTLPQTGNAPAGLSFTTLLGCPQPIGGYGTVTQPTIAWHDGQVLHFKRG